MNKTEQIYKKILQRDVVNKDDLAEISREVLGKVDTKYLYWKYISRLLREGKVKKIRRGLYFGVPMRNVGEDFNVDRYLLADRLRNGYALGYHTALELHGAAYSAFSSVYVLVRKENRFRPIKFQDVEYIPVVNTYHDGHLMTLRYRMKEVMVTDQTRTFVECLSRVDLCGGWEECLKSLADLRRVTVPRVIAVLGHYHNKALQLKCGYILEMLSNRSPYYSHVIVEELEPLTPEKGWIPVYLDRKVSSELNRKWGIYVPIGLEGFLRGV
jgi:predicted transcriptional regulator of viral defense system